MNWEVIWTAVGLLVAGLFILPFYIGLMLAYQKSKSKIDLEFHTSLNIIYKEVHMDSAIERLFDEEGGH